VTNALARLLRRLLVIVPVERRDWAEAVVNETVDVPAGRARLAWLLGAGRLMFWEAVVKRWWVRAVSLAGHITVAVAAVWVVAVVTEGISYVPLRRAMITLVVVIVAVVLLGWMPRVLGPVADDAAARVVRGVGFLLAGLAVWGVVVEFWYNRDPSQANPGVAERADTGIPMATVLFAFYLAAFLAVTGRGSALRGASLIRSAALAAVAVLVWSGLAIVVPEVSAVTGVAVMIGAGIGAAAWVGRQEVAPTAGALAGLLSAVMTAQIVVSVADVMFHLGPDSWIPDAGPGPLTLQDRLAQNRVEAIDPYVAVLLIGALLAFALMIVTVVQRARIRDLPRPEAATEAGAVSGTP
jgi:hypothetical protein